MKNLLLLFILTAICSFATNNLQAQVNPKISVQGTLKDANSVTVADGTYPITFKLYHQLEGGTAVWEETADVAVSGGIYSYNIGTTEVLNPAVFEQPVFLGVNVNDVELSPRGEMTFAPYALAVEYAATAGSLVGGGCTGAVGDVKYSILPLTDFQTENGDCWVAFDGADVTGSKLANDYGMATLPDGRGMFLRGHDDRTTASGERQDTDRDENTAIGTVQEDEFAAHSHTEKYSLVVTTSNFIYGLFNNNSASTGPYSLAPSNTTTGDQGGSETRPKNLNLYMYVRIN